MQDFDNYLLLPRSKQKETLRKVALLYCDGVGEGTWAYLYKAGAEIVFWSIAGALSTALYASMSNGIITAKAAIDAVESQYNALCSQAVTDGWSWFRQTSLTNSACRDMGIAKENFIFTMNKALIDLRQFILNSIMNSIMVTSVPVVLTATVDTVKTKGKDYTNTKMVSNIIYNMRDTVVCFIAKTLEILVEFMSKTCGHITSSMLPSIDYPHLQKLKF